MASSFDSASSPYAAAARNGAADFVTAIAALQAKEALATTGSAFITTEAQLRYHRRRTKRWTVFIATGCMVAFFLGLIIMFVEWSTYTFLAFIFPIFTGPWAIRQRRKLNKLPTLRFVINQIREEANVLVLQNNKLHLENNRLAKEISRLNDVETKLQSVAEKNGSNVAAICELVKENATTLRQMKQMQCARELQSLLTAVLQSDMNADHVLSPKELEMLLLRCQSFSIADEVKLREALMAASAANASTTTLYNVAATQSFDQGLDFTFGYGQWLFEEEELDKECDRSF